MTIVILCDIISHMTFICDYKSYIMESYKDTKKIILELSYII